MKIICENPTIILNPRLKFYLHMCDRVYIHDFCVYCGDKLTCIDLNTLSPKRNNISVDNYEDCVIVNSATSQCFPLYTVVPCGKCRCCKYKKYREFCARCEAETSVHSSVPLFITLTYSPQFLPKEGLNKRDLQLFFKRLRARMEYYGYNNEIRYTACGEYGKRTHRAHYHLIIWGFPTEKFATVDGINYASINKFIQRCWSRFVLTPEGKRIPKLLKDGQPMLYPSGKKVYQYVEIGFSLTKPLVKNGCKYVAKYMLKDCEIPLGKKDTFMCSSIRGGGIGSKFVDSKKEDLYSNLDLTSFPVFDKISGSNTTLPIGNYVKNRLLPPHSRALGQKLYDKCKTFFYKLSCYNEWYWTVLKFYHADAHFKNHPEYETYFVESVWNKLGIALPSSSHVANLYSDVIQDLITIVPHDDYYIPQILPCDVILKRTTYEQMVVTAFEILEEIKKLAEELRTYSQTFQFCHEIDSLKEKRSQIFYNKSLIMPHTYTDVMIEKIVEQFEREEIKRETSQKL